jgi:hypothetical protein
MWLEGIQASWEEGGEGTRKRNEGRLINTRYLRRGPKGTREPYLTKHSTPLPDK